jgi:hypothetical protein
LEETYVPDNIGKLVAYLVSAELAFGHDLTKAVCVAKEKCKMKKVLLGVLLVLTSFGASAQNYYGKGLKSVQKLLSGVEYSYDDGDGIMEVKGLYDGMTLYFEGGSFQRCFEESYVFHSKLQYDRFVRSVWDVLIKGKSFAGRLDSTVYRATYKTTGVKIFVDLYEGNGYFEVKLYDEEWSPG